MAGAAYSRSSMATRRAARRGRYPTLSYSPDAIAAFMAVFGLAFVTILGSKGALLFLLAGMALVVSRPGETLAATTMDWGGPFVSNAGDDANMIRSLTSHVPFWCQEGAVPLRG